MSADQMRDHIRTLRTVLSHLLINNPDTRRAYERRRLTRFVRVCARETDPYASFVGFVSCFLPCRRLAVLHPDGRMIEVDLDQVKVDKTRRSIWYGKRTQDNQGRSYPIIIPFGPPSGDDVKEPEVQEYAVRYLSQAADWILREALRGGRRLGGTSTGGDLGGDPDAFEAGSGI